MAPDLTDCRWMARCRTCDTVYRGGSCRPVLGTGGTAAEAALTAGDFGGAAKAEAGPEPTTVVKTPKTVSRPTKRPLSQPIRTVAWAASGRGKPRPPTPTVVVEDDDTIPHPLSPDLRRP